MMQLLDECDNGQRTPRDTEVIEAFGKDTQNWAQGAHGEHATATLLEQQLPGRAVILHNAAVPGSTTNIDHTICTVDGTYVIDSKNWSG